MDNKFFVGQLNRCHDFSKNVFNDRTVIVCDQCEKEYHIGCLREHSMADLQALPKGNWFCSEDCERIHSVLKDLVTLEPKIIPDDILALVREKQKDGELDVVANSEMRFVLLSGKNATRETRKMLAQTVDIFHECFDPILDATTGRDFIPSMVYGSNVVSVGTLRVFSEDIAELPIVATSKCNQGKGYFQLLFTCIERLLSSMKIKKLVLPAAEEAKSIWTNKFGFEPIEPPQLKDLKQTCSAMMTFKGTSMLQKDIPETQNGVAVTAGEENSNINLSVHEAQNAVADTAGEDNSSIKPLFPEAQNVITDTEAEDNGDINLLVPEAQNGVADTAVEDNGNIKPSLPEAQNGVPDTAGEDNGDINLSVSETQNGVADTAGEDNGDINLSVSETQNGVADTAGEDIGNISPLVE
ncbi:zinc finger, RING/FYVE/PHD-type, acyl-CoA N-acyltransferase, Jas TPL-binding domain protein [Tanacetum coccineum]